MSQDLDQMEQIRELSQKKGLLSKYNNVEIVAYIGAALSALTATWLSVGRMFADKLEKVGLLSKIHHEKNTAYKAFFNSASEHTLSSSMSKISEIEQNYRNEFNKIAKERFGAVTTFDKWRLLRPHQQIQTAATFLGILTIAAVALYTIRKEKIAQEAIEEKHRQTQLEHEETKAEVQRIEAKIEEIKDSTEELAKEQPVAMGQKSEAALKQREAANENKNTIGI
jgi:hypothetical protein